MGDLSRWEGPDGQWATFREAYSWGQSNRINEGFEGESTKAAMEILATETVTGLHVKDMTGGWCDEPGADTWERMDGKAGEAISVRCLEIWTAWRTARDPKDTTLPSTDSPPRAASRTRRRSS